MKSLALNRAELGALAALGWLRRHRRLPDGLVCLALFVFFFPILSDDDIASQQRHRRMRLPWGQIPGHPGTPCYGGFDFQSDAVAFDLVRASEVAQSLCEKPDLPPR
ncbi:MAG: hypothetical protein GIW99_01640 [Candidatus Eremiobacteraeota bacterium]|nr:hypothetical protein [Candidatus Eremiobacteraeota bacterium]MBC5826381.1 hypothetical protein [Candidatus Eremiobacteraeota bacterium]